MSRFLTRLVFLFAFLLPASHAQTFILAGPGEITTTGPISGSGDWPLQATGSDYLFVGYGSGWSLLSDFVFNVNNGTGSGTFSFSKGADSLSGTLTSSGGVIAAGAGFNISYTVTSGTGVFANLIGNGTSVARLLEDPNGPPPISFLESGIMNLQPIPEPETALMLVAGIALLAARRMKRD
jgi:hypothetical protein